MEADAGMDIGKVLQDARIAKNISLDTAAQETNIRKAYLEAIEQNDFASLHGAVFVKGVMRTYGNYLGMDGAQLVEEYKAASSGTGQVKNNNMIRESQHVRVRPTFKSNRDIGSGNGNSHKKLILFLGILVILLAAAGGFYFYQTRSGNAAPVSLPFRFNLFNGAREQSQKSSENKKVTGEQGKTAAVPQAAQIIETKKPEISGTKSASANNPEAVKGITKLNVASVGKCWLRVTDQKGTVLFEGNLLKGENKAFTSDSDIIMRIGNLKDLRIEYNGKALPFEQTIEPVTRIYKPNEQ